MPQVIPSICQPEGFYGVYPGELNEGTAYMLGRAFTQLLRCRRVLVGRDVKTASISLGRSFVRGLLEEGVQVEDVGVVNAGYLSFACNQADFDGAVMVSQSRLIKNTPQIGFELWRSRAVPLSPDDNLRILALVRQGVPDRRVAMGALSTRDYSSLYLEVLTRSRTIGSHSVAVDASNGMSALTLPAILGRFPQLRIVPLRMEPTLSSDEPLAEVKSDQLIKLKGAIRQNHADLGAYFSSDGRGLAVVTAQGELVSGDQLTSLLAKRQLIKHSGAAVVYPIHGSWVVADEVRAAGGAAVTAQADHGSVTAAMRAQRAALAAGAAGRYYFKDIYGTANAEFALLELLEILTDAKKPLSELTGSLKRYAQSGLTLYEVKDPAAFIDLLATTFSAGKQSRDIQSRHEGLTIEYPDWHLSVWPVPDQQAIRLQIEARTTSTLSIVRSQVHVLLERSPATAAI